MRKYSIEVMVNAQQLRIDVAASRLHSRVMCAMDPRKVNGPARDHQNSASFPFTRRFVEVLRRRFPVIGQLSDLFVGPFFNDHPP